MITYENKITINGMIRTFLFISLCLIWGLLLGWTYDDPFSSTVKENNYIQELTNYSNYTDCANRSLTNTSICLRDYMETFYNYKVRDDVRKTEQDIRENGGDCYDYAWLYYDWATALGFYAITVRVEGEDMAHRFTVISDDSGYCLLDQVNIKRCFIYTDE